ncbi:hypothetical protein SDC9_65732 [bioreactor metagenome]|uniref:Uncharacterized protein n=1 Tax=bioreactor metagenome TaxID=1076179 RepID=A0A644XT97_9ZZZZ
MDQGTDSHADEDIQDYLFYRCLNLFLGINDAVAFCKFRGLNVHASGGFDKALYIFLHAELFDERPADDCENESHNHISDSDLCSEYAHEKDQRAEVHQR